MSKLKYTILYKLYVTLKEERNELPYKYNYWKSWFRKDKTMTLYKSLEKNKVEYDRKAYMREYIEKNKDKYRDYHRKNMRKLREKETKNIIKQKRKEEKKAKSIQ